MNENVVELLAGKQGWKRDLERELEELLERVRDDEVVEVAVVAFDDGGVSMSYGSALGPADAVRAVGLMSVAHDIALTRLADEMGV